MGSSCSPGHSSSGNTILGRRSNLLRAANIRLTTRTIQAPGPHEGHHRSLRRLLMGWMHPTCGGLYIFALLGFGAICAHLYLRARGEGVKLKFGLDRHQCKMPSEPCVHDALPKNPALAARPFWCACRKGKHPPAQNAQSSWAARPGLSTSCQSMHTLQTMHCDLSGGRVLQQGATVCVHAERGCVNLGLRPEGSTETTLNLKHGRKAHIDAIASCGPSCRPYPVSGVQSPSHQSSWWAIALTQHAHMKKFLDSKRWYRY